MQTVLNFSGEDRELIRGKLASYEKAEKGSAYEELRAMHKGCTITLYTSGKLVIQGDKHAEVALEITGLMKKPQMPIVGIDEAGRGENFGPFVIAGVLADRDSMRTFRDSKKTSNVAGKAEAVSEKALAIATFSINAELIDLLREKGINMNGMEASAIDSACSFFRALLPEAGVFVDGNEIRIKSRAVRFEPKADDSNPVVGAASVTAKSARDSSKDKRERKSWKTKGKQSG